MIKTTQDSYTIMTEMILSSHVNGSGRLFGGQLMSWMDIAGAICAKRHSHHEVVTACVNQLEFFHPAMPNDVVVITAKCLHVGNTSMKVKVSVHIEPFGLPSSEKILTCSAFFIYVAQDKEGNKCVVPRLIAGSEQDRIEMEQADSDKKF